MVPKTKKRRYCNFTIGDYKGTFLQDAKLPPWKVILFTNHWLSSNWDISSATECLRISRTTCIEWRSFCSEVTEYWLLNQDSIGGPGITVEIDETIVKRKSDRGCVLAQVWLFGGIERCSKKHFILPLVGPLGEAEERDKGTLVPLIQEYIRPGSIIVSDQWGVHKQLNDLGYTHHTTNISKKSVGTSQSDVHTQNIERLWRDVKEWVRRSGIRRCLLHHYLSRYLFLKAHSHTERLHMFFTYAAKLYRPQSNQHRQLLLHLDGDSDDESE